MTQDVKYSPKYVKSGVYPEASRTWSHKAVQDVITKEFPYWSEFGRKDNVKPSDRMHRAYRLYLQQSEFKKPYMPPGYKEMEYDPTYPGRPTGPRRRVDGPDLNPFRPGSILGPIRIVFDLNSDSEYCPDESTSIIVTGTEPIYFVQTTMTDDRATKAINIKGYGTNRVTFDLDAGDERGPVTIEASMTSVEGVVGHSNVNLPESDECSDFIITLIRDDGTPVDEALLKTLHVVRASLGWTTAYTKEYQGGGKWVIQITGARDPGDLYFLKYRTESGDNGENIWMQYPDKHLTADWSQAGDRITYGTYEDSPVYFDIINSWDTTPVAFGDIPTQDAQTTCVADGPYWFDVGAGYNGILVARNASITWQTTVGSSVPYDIRIRTGTGSRRLAGTAYIPIAGYYACGGTPSAPEDDLCYWHSIFGSGVCTPSAHRPPFQVNPNLMCTWIEAVSDGLPSSTLSGDGDGDYPDYDEGKTISSPVIGGKTHSFGYTVTGSSFAADFVSQVPLGFCESKYCESITSVSDGGAMHFTGYPTFTYDLVGMDF